MFIQALLQLIYLRYYDIYKRTNKVFWRSIDIDGKNMIAYVDSLRQRSEIQIKIKKIGRKQIYLQIQGESHFEIEL